MTGNSSEPVETHMGGDAQKIRRLLRRVRRRWQWLVSLQAGARTGLRLVAVLTTTVLGAALLPHAPTALTALGLAAVVVSAVVVGVGMWRARRRPTDLQVARLVEEREPSLDACLISATDLLTASKPPSGLTLAPQLMADAARRVSSVAPADVVSSHSFRSAGLKVAASMGLLVIVALVGREPAQRVVDAARITLLPSRLWLEVTPGSVRLAAGAAVTIQARVTGGGVPAVAQLLRADLSSTDDEDWRVSEMTEEAPGVFRLPLESVDESFRYRVVAGALKSEVYSLVIARPPRVTRIDVDYTYPPALHIKPHSEEDGGDIYAPEGTEVTLRIQTDAETATGQLMLGDGSAIPLRVEVPARLTGGLRVSKDTTYRIALADRDGLNSPGDTEYFIRMLHDRPPEVRVTKPARDRSVTKLEEVDIEAEADDDFAIERADLVYSVRGGAEKVVALRVAKDATHVSATHTLYLEDLDVQPGDFVTYYVRARDVGRGKRSSEARSDIFFLEVKPYDQEFTLAQSQGLAGGTGSRTLDDLVNAQKQIIVATWKLDRRSLSSGARSDADIRAVADAEAELKTRVEQASSAFRESMMRDPRRRQPGRGVTPDTPRAGQTLSEEDAMTSAAAAMAQAVVFLSGLSTTKAVPPELEALNHLLRAQSDVKKRQVTRQQAGNGGGQNRASQDLSSLFDKELQRQQQTNYETPTSAETRDESADALSKIKELAERQDELLKRQQELSRKRTQMTPEELRRELDRLSRDQAELRQRADEMARQMASRAQEPPSESRAGQQGQTGESQGGRQTQGENAKRMREVSEEMLRAASGLRRQDEKQAAASGSRALEQLRSLEDAMRRGAPDEQRRARGDLQMEARQLADAERQLANELARVPDGAARNDALRRLAGTQERLAERARNVQEGLRRQAAGAAANRTAPDKGNREGLQRDLAEAARGLQGDRVPERMQELASALRDAAQRESRERTEPNQSKRAAEPVETEQAAQIARALERVADQLSRADAMADGQSRKLSSQREQAADLRERIESLTREVERLTNPGRDGGGASGSDLARLRDLYAKQLQEARALLDQLRRDDPTSGQSGPGLTFEGQGMTLSAPGTEAFKQDFSKWAELSRQVTQTLARAESTLTRKLQAREAAARLPAGVDDQPPVEYQQQVDSYFKSIAERRQR